MVVEGAPVNHGFTYVEMLDDRRAGCSLLGHLLRHRHSDEATWRARIEAGEVAVDGQPGRPDQVLRPGQTVAWARPPWEEPAVPLNFGILYEDAELLAVAKPSGLPTLPAGGFLEHTLLHLVRQAFPEASPLHRLGRGTSGLVLFFRTPEAGAALAAGLRAHRLEKVYRALVEGHPPEARFQVEVPIGPVPHGRLGTVHAASPSGRPALSRARVLERREAHSLLEVQIETGRPHQIRIHMAAAGFPLAGDPLYAPGGGIRAESPALPGDLGYLLHAHRLGLPHPRTGTWMELSCPPPEPLQTRLEAQAVASPNCRPTSRA